MGSVGLRLLAGSRLFLIKRCNMTKLTQKQSERERIKGIIKNLPKGYVDKQYVSVFKEKELFEMIDKS